MSNKMIIAMILLIAMGASLILLNKDSYNHAGLSTDRSSVASANTDYYRRNNVIALLNKPLKEYIQNDVRKLYNFLVAEFGQEHVDNNMFEIDISELKRARSLQRLVDTKRVWIGDRTDPSFLITPGDEDDPEIVIENPNVDKPLDSLRIVVYETNLSSAEESLNPRPNNLVLGGGSDVSEVTWDYNKRFNEFSLNELFPGLSNLSYLSNMNREIHVVGGTNSIFKKVR